MTAVSECNQCGSQSDMPFHIPAFSLLNCPGCGAQGSYVAIQDAETLTLDDAITQRKHDLKEQRDGANDKDPGSVVRGERER